MKKFDLGLVWLNLLFLIFLSFIPFPVDLFGEYSNSDIIVAFYCLSLSLVGFLLSGLWFYSRARKLVDNNLNKIQLNYYSIRFLLAPIIFAISVPLSFIDPILAKICWAFVVIGIVLINLIFSQKERTVVKESI